MVLGIIIGRVAKVEPGGQVEKVVGWDIGKIWTDFFGDMHAFMHSRREGKRESRQAGKK